MTKQISTVTISKTISYLYLLSYSPPENIDQFRAVMVEFRQQLGADIWDDAIQVACEHIVSFHSASRQLDLDLVSGLVAAARTADADSEAARAFQAQMDEISQLSGRAKPNNRLHRKRGCRLCQKPCRYGYFSLISAPNFEQLPSIIKKHPSQPIRALWHYTIQHVVATLGIGGFSINATDLGDLAYCLLSLATTKSRYPFPEAQMKKFQTLNQAAIRQMQGSTDGE